MVNGHALPISKIKLNPQAHTGTHEHTFHAHLLKVPHDSDTTEALHWTKDGENEVVWVRKQPEKDKPKRSAVGTYAGSYKPGLAAHGVKSSSGHQHADRREKDEDDWYEQPEDQGSVAAAPSFTSYFSLG